jgi:hypothetical protein
MVKKILVGVLVVVALFIGAVATRPNTWEVKRSTSIAAPPDVVFGLVNDFKAWTGWSPWEGLDANLQRTYEGAPSGVGSIYKWVGNKDVGQGQMTILSAKSPEEIEIKVEFLKPFVSTSQTVFTFKPEGSETQTTWTMTGENNFMTKAISLFASMDKMAGNDFDKGLAKLKTLAEAEAKKRTEATNAAAVPGTQAEAAAPTTKN